jgi:hypothetical protein
MFTRQTHAQLPVVGLLCLPALILSLSGCGAKDTIKLLPVEGIVMLGEKVLATSANTKGTVRLYPDRTKGNDSLEIPRGSIDSEGKFKILTGLKPGVAPGWYRVTVDAATVIDPKNPYHSASGFLVPERYIDKDESNLAFEVVENAPAGAYDLKLNSK